MRRALLALVVTLPALATPTFAAACINGVLHSVPPRPLVLDTPVALLRHAEERVERGGDDLPAGMALAAEARRRVQRDPDQALDFRIFGEVSPEARRAVAARLAGRATMIEELGRSRTPGANDEALELAARRIATLRDQHEALVTDATWGEVASRAPSRRAEAEPLLRKLGARDLLGSPWELVALASVAADAEDRPLEMTALRRCRVMGGGAQCTLPPRHTRLAGRRVDVALGSGAGLALAALASVVARRARRHDRALRALLG